jgi:NAD(P)-dependent dehydrogenase (short-subunit alcohol dehydrogenase family)
MAVNVRHQSDECGQADPAAFAWHPKASLRTLVMGSEEGVKPELERLHYSVSEAALVSLARGIAEMTLSTSATSNSIVVGPAWTEGTAEFLGIPFTDRHSRRKADVDDFDDSGVTSILRRLARSEEIDHAVALVCSPRASYINGAAPRVEGGIIRGML